MGAQAGQVPFRELLGADVVYSSAEECHVALEIRAELTNASGTLHGGALSGLADVAAGVALRRALEAQLPSLDPWIAARHLNIEYHRPAASRVMAISRVLTDLEPGVGDHLEVEVETVMKDDCDNTVVTARSHLVVRPRRTVRK